MTHLAHDLRYALRLIRKNPTFALVAVFTLALGIGANTAIFSIVDRVLLRPLPFPDAERLVIVWENDRLRGTQRENASLPDYLDIRSTSESFESISAYGRLNQTLTGFGDPRRLLVGRVTANFFETLGIRPLLGREFVEDDEKVEREQTALLGHTLWATTFGSDPAIVGKTIALDGNSFTVAGVMPPSALIAGNQEQLWIPINNNRMDKLRGRHSVRLYGRLKPRVNIASAQKELDAIMSRLEEQYTDDNMGRGAYLVPLLDDLVGNVRNAFYVILAAVGFVLLIACVNVANLLLARSTTRAKEIALRTALGAARSRIVRQLFLENMILASVGATLGFFFAVLGIQFVVKFGPRNVPRIGDIGVDWSLFGATLLVSLISWLLFGLLPALKSSQIDLNETLKESYRESSQGISGSRLRQSLVAAEVSLSVVLLVGAGLLIQSFQRIINIDSGFRPERVLSASMQLPGSKYPFPQGWPIHVWPQAQTFHRQLLEKVEALPDVQNAALALNPPFQSGWTTRATVVGQPIPPAGEQEEAYFRPVGENYFRTLGISLLKGRPFDQRDQPDGPKTAIINRSFVRRYFPNQEALGESINVFGVPREIVGIAPDIRFSGLTRDVRPTMYLPFFQNPQPAFTLVLRTKGEPANAIKPVGEIVQSLEPALALYDVTTLNQSIAGSIATQKFFAYLLAIFAAVALILAIIGIYGVLAFVVSQKTREIGIRMALGAGVAGVFRLIVGRGLRLALVGLVFGFAVSLALSRLLDSLLFQVSATDFLTYGLVSLILLFAAFVGCFLPARRAARVEPIEALRYE